MTPWNVPPPPRPPSRPIRAGRVFAGIGVAFAAHAATLLLLRLGPLVQGEDFANGPGLNALLIGQLVVFAGCLSVGVVLTVKRDGGVGVGLLIGWPMGLMIMLVAGCGIWVWAIIGAEH